MGGVTGHPRLAREEKRPVVGLSRAVLTPVVLGPDGPGLARSPRRTDARDDRARLGEPGQPLDDTARRKLGRTFQKGKISWQTCRLQREAGTTILNSDVPNSLFPTLEPGCPGGQRWGPPPGPWLQLHRSKPEVTKGFKSGFETKEQFTYQTLALK